MIIKKYLKNIIEVQNFFKEKDLLKILKKYKKCKKWKKIKQVRAKHYSHVFKNKSPYLPSKNEKYLSSFYRSKNLENDKFIKSIINNNLVKFFYKQYKIRDLDIDIRCHKFTVGDFFRVHMDGYAGGYAMTLSLNKNWKWDWGGILSVAHGKNESEVLSLLPKWNCANILNNYIHPSPHFLSSIQKHALETRYTITCFIKKNQINKQFI